MKNHGLWMIIACALPLLLIFLLPSFGVASDRLLFIFLLLCFGLHILMMRGHHGDHDNNHENKKEGDDGAH